MKYKSCRGGVEGVSFREALFSGYAEDGGMLLPEFIPPITNQHLTEWRDLTYPDLCKEILSLFISTDEIPREDLNKIVDRTYSQKFPKNSVLPMVQVGAPNFFIQEMFHGPTGAFKDLSMCMIGSLFDYFLEKDKRHVTVVVGTSGDTGSSAIYAVKNLKNVDIIVLYPKGRISKIQELQMISHPESSVHVFAVDGTSDDIDVPCRKVLSDIMFCREHNLASINSPNVGRIIIQIVHFFYAYLYVMRIKTWDNVVVAIPTGACGNLTSGYIAHLMGLPIKLQAAVNENDIVSNWINTGVFKQTTKVVKPTISPAIDILVPYNWERILYYVSSGNSKAVSESVKQFETKSYTEMPKEWYTLMRKTISGVSVPQHLSKTTIKNFYQNYKYILDPHTAIAVATVVQQSKVSKNTCFVCLSTASPSKFGESIFGIIGVLPNDVFGFEGGGGRSYVKEMKEGEDWEERLRDVIKGISKKREQLKAKL